MAVVQDKWRHQQYVVAALPVDGAAHRITDQAGLKCRPFQGFVDLPFGGERSFGVAVLDNFDPPEQAAPADVADVRMLPECGLYTTERNA